MNRIVFGVAETPGHFLKARDLEPKFGRVYNADESASAGGTGLNLLSMGRVKGVCVFSLTKDALASSSEKRYETLKLNILDSAKDGPHGIVLDFSEVDDVNPALLRRLLNGLRIGYKQGQGPEGKEPVIYNLDIAYLRAANIDELFESNSNLNAALQKAKQAVKPKLEK